MTPRQFLEVVVLPNVDEFHTHFADLRLAYNAISAVDALAAHLYDWVKTHAPSTVISITDDTLFRAELAKRDQDFALLRDIAKAQKHVHLTRGTPQVTRANQITARPIGFGEGSFGSGRYGGPEQIVVDISPHNFAYVEAVVDESLTFLEREMQRLGI
jgi:hypothetical protein